MANLSHATAHLEDMGPILVQINTIATRISHLGCKATGDLADQLRLAGSNLSDCAAFAQEALA